MVESIPTNEPSPVELFAESIGSDVKEITYEDLPDYIADWLEGRSELFIDRDDYEKGNFDRILLYQVEDKTYYVASQEKTYPRGDTEQITYFVSSTDNDISGYIEVRNNVTDEHEFFKDKPFVGFTRTIEGNGRQGLGTERLKHANELTKAEYGAPLHSDTSITDEAREVWKKLASENLAEKFVESNGKDRYRFTT